MPLGDGPPAAAMERLSALYPIVFLDCMVLKIRDGGTVHRRALYLALGVTLDGDRDGLGIWFQDTEGAKFWMQVLNDLKHRGVRGDPVLLRRRPDRVPRGDRGDLPEDEQPEHRAAEGTGARDVSPVPTPDAHGLSWVQVGVMELAEFAAWARRPAPNAVVLADDADHPTRVMPTTAATSAPRAATERS